MSSSLKGPIENFNRLYIEIVRCFSLCRAILTYLKNI
ncbi:hypothetical protein NEOC95_001556 [Neochlamydia sp. AcF95]|nr:hypothetical protein [Neochlamydia sp. AcF95]